MSSINKQVGMFCITYVVSYKPFSIYIQASNSKHGNEHWIPPSSRYDMSKFDFLHAMKLLNFRHTDTTMPCQQCGRCSKFVLLMLYSSMYSLNYDNYDLLTATLKIVRNVECLSTQHPSAMPMVCSYCRLETLCCALYVVASFRQLREKTV